MKETSHVVKGFKESIFTKMTTLATKYNAINLSQGLPNFDGPKWVREATVNAILEGKNQSSPAHGLQSLREAISNNYKKYYDLEYSPESEITVVNGATEGIFSTIQAIVNPGDEVIIVEPFFDTYIPAVKMAGGIPVIITMHAPNFTLNEDELQKAFSDKTKLMIINTPHNPSGKLFSEDELKTIAKYIIKYDSYLISDEVYEFLTFDNLKHIPPASIEGMQERTITISSTSKTFGLTGWRIGWCATSENLTHAIRMVHQNNTFTAPRPLQEGIAESLNKLDDHLPGFRKEYQDKRDLLLKGLEEAGYKPFIPNSSYFIMCPIESHTNKNDVDYCMELIEKCNVASIPPSAFYTNSKDGQKYLRFCFAKTDDILRQAINNLKK